MSLLRRCILPITLGLILAPVALAGDDDKKASEPKLEEQTIHGIVSEVTLVGETDIDTKTGKAVTAEEVFLTIVGHPAWNHEAMEKEKAHEQASNDKDKDRDVKRTSTDGAVSSERRHHRMNVYVIAVSSSTKVCERKEMGKEGSTSAKEEKCDLDKLEIGDRVEVTFARKSDEKKADDKDNAKVEPQKHGRHRVYFGMAKDIKILDEPWEAPQTSTDSSKK
jgi:hypothetical protein